MDVTLGRLGQLRGVDVVTGGLQALSMVIGEFVKGYWVFITGGCSGRGVQWMGFALCNKLVYHII